MELAYICRSSLENPYKVRIDGCDGSRDLIRGNLQGIELCAVKLFTVSVEGGIAVCTDIRDDFGNDGFHIHLRLHAGKDILLGHLAILKNAYHFSASICAAISRMIFPICSVRNW